MANPVRLRPLIFLFFVASRLIIVPVLADNNLGPQPAKSCIGISPWRAKIPLVEARLGFPIIILPSLSTILAHPPSASKARSALPSRSCRSQLLTTPYSRVGSFSAFHTASPLTVSYNHAILLPACPHAIPQSIPLHICLNPFLFHITPRNSQSPPCSHESRQLHSLRVSKRASHPSESSFTTRADAHAPSTTTYTAPPAHPSDYRRLSPSLLRPYIRDHPISEHN